MDQNPDILISAREVSTRYRISEKAVYAWARAGKIPSPVVRRKGYTRWSMNQITAHIDGIVNAAKKEAV